MRELAGVPQPDKAKGEEGKTFKGVGKMFVFQARGEVDRGHRETEKGLDEEIGNLVKKVSWSRHGDGESPLEGRGGNMRGKHRGQERRGWSLVRTGCW